MAGTPSNNAQTLIEEFEESFQVSNDVTIIFQQNYLLFDFNDTAMRACNHKARSINR